MNRIKMFFLKLHLKYKLRKIEKDIKLTIRMFPMYKNSERLKSYLTVLNRKEVEREDLKRDLWMIKFLSSPSK